MRETILTPAQTCGPLFGFALFPEGLNQAADPAATDSITLEGVIRDGAGEPIGHGAFVEFWSAGQAARARTLDGRFRVTMARPSADAPNAGGTPTPCLSVLIFTRGLARGLMTRVYFPEDAAAHVDDPVLRLVAPELRARLVAATTGDARHYTHDIYLQGAHESVFFAVESQ